MVRFSYTSHSITHTSPYTTTRKVASPIPCPDPQVAVIHRSVHKHCIPSQNKTPLRFMKLFQLLLITNTLELLSPLLPPTLFPLISTSQEARSLDPWPYRLSRLSFCHHPPHSKHTSTALTSGNTNYSTTPPPIPTCSVYQKHSKPNQRSSLHLTDPSLLLSEPMDRHAPYLMASILPQTTDPYSAIFYHPSMLERMSSSPIFVSCIE